MYLQPHSKPLCWTEPNPCSQQTAELPGPSLSHFPVKANRVVSPRATPCLHSRSHCSPAAAPGSFPSREGTSRARIAGSSPQTWSTRVCKPPRAQGGAQSPSAMSSVTAAAEPLLRAPGIGGERALRAGGSRWQRRHLGCVKPTLLSPLRKVTELVFYPLIRRCRQNLLPTQLS